MGLALPAAAMEGASDQSVTVRVDRDAQRYRVQVELAARVPMAAVVEQLTDYEHLYQLHPDIDSSEVLSRGDGVTRVRTRTTRCVLFFCFHFTQVSDVRMLSESHLQADIVPEQSDYRYGRMDWQLAEHDGVTTLHYQAELEPGFWVPPIIGHWLVENQLESVSRTMMENLLRRIHDGDIPTLRQRSESDAPDLLPGDFPPRAIMPPRPIRPPPAIRPPREPQPLPEPDPGADREPSPWTPRVLQ